MTGGCGDHSRSQSWMWGIACPLCGQPVVNTGFVDERTGAFVFSCFECPYRARVER